MKKDRTICEPETEFRSLVEKEIHDTQLRISNHNLSRIHAIATLKQALLRTLQYKEFFVEDFETKLTDSGSVALVH